MTGRCAIKIAHGVGDAMTDRVMREVISTFIFFISVRKDSKIPLFTSS